MNTCYLSTIETPTDHHRNKFIIHTQNTFANYFAEFETEAQLEFFAETIGLKITEQRERRLVMNPATGEQNNEYKEFLLNIDTIINRSFWNRDDVPKGAKPIKALSNGSKVTCYYLKDGKTLFFYRPNPNARLVYDPMPTDQHIAHTRIYGSY